MWKVALTAIMILRSRLSLALISTLGCAVVLAGVDMGSADTTPLLDADRGVVLPSSLAEGIFEQQRARAKLILQVDEWEITKNDLTRVDSALATALKKEHIGQGLPTLPHYYRQYLPGRLQQSRIIFVNGFAQTQSDMFPDRATPADQWKHELMTAYGGGCGFWHGIYSVEQDRFLVLDRTGGHDRVIMCNAPK
jgi:hypothetical protein